MKVGGARRRDRRGEVPAWAGRASVPGEDLTAIVNSPTTSWCTASMCRPDPDSVTYWLGDASIASGAGAAASETFRATEELRAFDARRRGSGSATSISATHLFRTGCSREGVPLSEVTGAIAAPVRRRRAAAAGERRSRSRRGSRARGAGRAARPPFPGVLGPRGAARRREGRAVPRARRRRPGAGGARGDRRRPTSSCSARRTRSCRSDRSSRSRDPRRRWPRGATRAVGVSGIVGRRARRRDGRQADARGRDRGERGRGRRALPRTCSPAGCRRRGRGRARPRWRRSGSACARRPTRSWSTTSARRPSRAPRWSWSA